MIEFSTSYPNYESFIEASAIVSHEFVMESSNNMGIMPTYQEIEQIVGLMTPKSIRDSSSHGGQVISSDLFPTFDSLVARRKQIRDLQLIALRSPAVQAEYEKMEKNTFLNIIQKSYLRGANVALVKELYPTAIPEDVAQHVIWVRNDDIPDSEIADFIARTISLAELSSEDVILFERSRVTETPFVRAAVPEYRHLHLWLRGKTAEND